MKNIIILFFICLFKVFLIAGCYAQSGGDIFYHLTTENGLSSNRVNAIIEDHEGFYWIATQDGLNCFNGSTCKIFRNVKNDTTSISHNDCFLLAEDNTGDIWVGTQAGLNVYKKKEGRFERFFFSNPKYSFEQVNGIRGLAKDEQGNIWVCSAGLWEYDILRHTWKAYLNDSKDPSSLPFDFAGLIQYDKNNHGLWLTSDVGFVFFDLKEHKFYSARYNPSNLAIFNVKDDDGIFTLDYKGNIWFHTIPNKLYKYSVSKNKLEEITQLTYNGLSQLSVDNNNRVWLHYWIGNTLLYNLVTRTFDSSFLRYSHPQSPITLFTKGLYIDKEDNYWIFSNEGINIYNSNEQAASYYILNDQKKMDKSLYFAVSCIVEQNDSILWIGSNNGLYKYNTIKKKEQLFSNIKVRDDFIRCLFIQDDSVLWIGGHHELIRYHIRENKILQTMGFIWGTQMITEDAKKNIWLATWSNGLYKFSRNGKKYKQFLHISDTIRSPFSNSFLFLSSAANKQYAWIGYNGGAGFSNFDFNSEAFSNFKIADTSPDKRISNSINCITEDKNGNIWLGTYGGGLTFYDIHKKKYTTYTQSDGLKGNFINGIVEDDNSHMWIETTNGLSIFDMNNRTIISSEIDISQESNDYFQNGLRRKNKHILFFSNNQIVEIDPDIFMRTAYPSKIVYSSFKIFDEEKILAKTKQGSYELKLPHNKNFFSFEYSVLKANPQKNIQYAYLLKGFDKDWNYVRERRTAYYTNVPPGHYTFLVQAADKTGKWQYFSKPIAIIISPPFWKTWWFISICIVLLLLGLYALYRYRIEQLKKMITIRTKISQDLHDEIASTLSGIRLYSELAKQQLEESNTGKVMESLGIISTNASEMKGGISDIVWAINPSNDSFKVLMEKLKLYASDITKAAGIFLEFDTISNITNEKLDMPQRRNIYLICKEAINNSVKYSNAEKINVQIQQQDHIIMINISDNGIGFDTKNISLGNGILNIKQRAKDIGAWLFIQSVPGKGSHIELKIKI